uniref:Uncharacterized protein n=1 Tax=Siphoviridae sp. ctrKX6 TaxID=2826476 RepID=A0A8S5NJ01_9CAUD|nr:MAG TPA: hypothetical protein [Siphoviridae sp. ctrKX6]
MALRIFRHFLYFPSEKCKNINYFQSEKCKK